MLNDQDIILKELFNVISLNDSPGMAVTGFNEIQKYHKFLLLLKSESLEEDVIKRKLEHMRYYFRFENEPVFIEADDILIFLKQQQTPVYKLFIDLLYKKLDDMQRTLDIKNYVLYYPINVNKLKNEITEFQIEDIKISLLNYSDVKKHIDDQDLENKVFKVNHINKTRYRYAKVSIWSRNREYAQKKATRYVELMLFFISYSKTFRKTSFVPFGIPKPLTELKLNHIFVFEDDVYSAHYYFEDTSKVTKYYDLEDNDFENLNTMISQFNKADVKIKEIIHDSMEQYHIGLKENSSSRSFLGFWTTLEILTLKNKDLSHFKVKERLKSVIKMNSIHEYQIERLYNLRNKLVHTGKDSEISQFDRNLMKSYIEVLFQYFMFNFSKYSYSEIGTIYDLLQKDISYLEKNKNLIDEVIALKSPK